jgi:hypothetical protein
VKELRGPEANRPAQRRGDTGVGHDHQHLGAALRVGDVDDFVVGVSVGNGHLCLSERTTRFHGMIPKLELK